MCQWMRQCYMLMVIRRACDYASLLVGWLVNRKGRTGPSGADQPNLKREETKKRVGSKNGCLSLVEQRNSNLLDLDIRKYVKYAHTTRSSRDRAFIVRHCTATQTSVIRIRIRYPGWDPRLFRIRTCSIPGPGGEVGPDIRVLL
jgi:hypothetical protein